MRVACSPAHAWKGVAALAVWAAGSLSWTEAVADEHLARPERTCVDAYARAAELERYGHLTAAKTWLLRCTQTPCRSSLRDTCASLLTRVELETPSVIPLVKDEQGRPVTDVSLVIDGRLSSRSLDGRALPVDPGLHEFSFVGREGVFASEKVVISQGVRNRPLAVVRRASGPAGPVGVIEQKAPPASPAAPAPPPAAEELPRLLAGRATTAISLDGRLREAAWKSAPLSDMFVQRFPDEGTKPSERTVVRVVYDPDAIYVGVLCEQRHVPLRLRLTRRDRVTDDSDRVTVVVSSRHDGASAFRFTVTAAGVLSDDLYYDDSTFDTAWDENWEAATAVVAEGWSAEYRIPLRVLRFEARPVQEWGFNVHRFIAGRQETADWSHVPRIKAGYVSRLGRLENLVGLSPPHSEIELRPFAVARFERQDAALGSVAEVSGPANVTYGWESGAGSALGMGGSIGLDARWHLTRDLTLDATLNPDFGQVEADQVVLNLTTMETTFPEKRPFFLEGREIFGGSTDDTYGPPMNVLYTRRVGAVPSVPAPPAGETLATNPRPSPIPVALKLAGRLGPRLSVGLLSAVTGTNVVRTEDELGSSHRRLAAPPTVFNVLRLKGALSQRASFGVTLAGTKRLEPASVFGLYPRTTGGALGCPGQSAERGEAGCFGDAYVAASDARWRSASGDYRLVLQSATSLLSGGPPRRLKDGTTLGEQAVGTGASWLVAKEGGAWRWNFFGYAFSPRFELNDAGYLARQNQIAAYLDLIYAHKEPLGPTLESEGALEYRQARDLNGLILRNSGQLRFAAKLRNHWRLLALLQYKAPSFDDREVGDGTALEHAGLWGTEITVAGDPRRLVSGALFGRSRRLTNGWEHLLEGAVLVRPLPRLDLEVLPNLAYTTGEPRYLEKSPDGRLLFGRLEAANVGATLRLTYAFSPRLTLQSYAQVFLAFGRYTDFSSHERPPWLPRPAIRLDNLVATTTPPGKRADFERAALNASVLLRWEYRLGATLYLVYSRSQVPDIALDAERRPTLDLRPLIAAPAADVFLLKLSYWWA